MASEHLSPSTASRTSLRAKIVLLCLSLVVGGSITEGAVRVAEYLRKSLPAKTISSERPLRYYLPESSTSNRGNPNPDSSDAASFRIAVVGDSFTFGPHMQSDDAFPARLERLLNLNGTDKDAPTQRAVVLNLGRPGFSTRHEIATVRTALANKPSLVLLEITLNDPQLRPLNEEPPEVQGQFGPYRPTGFLRFLTEHWRTLHLVLSRIHNTQSVKSYIAYHEYLFNNPAPRDSFLNALTEISSLCKEAQVPLAIVLFPLFDFPIDESYPFSPIHSMVVENAKKRDIPILDLRSHFQGIDVYRLQLIPGKDTHPNEIAHRIAAEAILRFLAKRHLIPQQFVPRLAFKERTNYYRLGQKQTLGGSLPSPH